MAMAYHHYVMAKNKLKQKLRSTPVGYSPIRMRSAPRISCDSDFSTSKGEPTGALYGLSTMLIKIAEQLKPDYIVARADLPGPQCATNFLKHTKRRA